jgi:K+-transporting ATPase ATPase C chain
VREALAAGLRCALVLWLACGLLYPLAVTGAARLFPFQADGSLLREADGTIIGSRLIGQAWVAPRWFHGRSSATSGGPYNASASGGSNLGPTSELLARRLAADRKALETAQPELLGVALPADALTASGSGLDPDVSVANALLQVPRIARERGVSAAVLRAFVARHVAGRSLGIFGEPRVNVLELNLALDRSF